MRSSLLIGLFAFLLLGGSIYPAIGQTNSFANYIVINEVEINPYGDDAASISEWVELYNPTQTSVDIGGWTIASTTLLKKTFTIPIGTVIEPDEYLVFNHVTLWFPDVAEVVELRDKTGKVIDRTPEMTDLKNDYTSWQRIWDGIDNDSDSDWEFVQFSVGSSNGKLQVVQEQESTSVTVETDKENYIFGETATITGTVSERIYVERPFFTAAKINIKIFGPDGYQKNIEMFPDMFLGFETNLGLHQVLGVFGGKYTVSVEYDNSNSVVTFSVGDEVILVEKKEAGVLSVSTDKETYLPGESVKITAITNDIIPLEGLKFNVFNSNFVSIFKGNLFPNLNNEFSTSVFITTVNPVHGTFQIITDYSTQHAETTFTVLEDAKEAKLLSLNVEKFAYGLNDIVVISGRLNTGWVPHFDLLILQTSTTSDFAGEQSLDQYTQDTVQFSDQVDLKGDSSFRYEYRVLNNENSYGEYKVTVSNDAATAQAFFVVRENPDEFEELTEQMAIFTDKEFYNLEDELVVTGYVADVKTRTSFEIPSVEMKIKDEQGKDVQFLGCPKGSAGGKNQEQCDIPSIVTLTGVPNLSGAFKTTIPLTIKLFEPGKYTINGDYDVGKYMASKSFVINDQQSLDISSITATLDKDVYGLNEIVTLSGKVSSDFPQRSLSITITKPDGSTSRQGVAINDADDTFSWIWKTPESETIFAQLDHERSTLLSNYGLYQIRISSESEQTKIIFMVAENPDQAKVLFDEPIKIVLDKSVYDAGEKLTVKGFVEKREFATSVFIPERVKIQVKDNLAKNLYESYFHPSVSGQFKETYTLPITLFPEGTYRVVATYFDLRDEVYFDVINDFNIGTSNEIAVLMSLDKEEYYPGETVVVTGKTNRLISLEHFELRVIQDDPTRITCGSFYCGQSSQPTFVVPDQIGGFTFEYKIPDSSDSIGAYEINAKTDFSSTSSKFIVVEKPLEVEKKIVTEGEKSAKKIIEKFNRIPDIFIPITVGQKTVNGDDMSPRVIRGSLFTTVRGDESSVNIQVTIESGICVIGLADDCLVKDSTRGPGAIYKVVEVDGVSYNIRYSGPDVRLEKFDIVPESSDVLIPDSTWNIDVIKNDQPTRFYYKVSYVPVE